MQAQWLIDFFLHHSILVYIFIALVASFEGPILSMLGGVLLHSGYMSLVPLYLSLMIGDLLGDTFWYFLGRHLGEPFVKKHGHYFSINQKQVDIVKKIFHKYHNRILILSKITMGFGFAIVTLFTAGMIKIPFKKYILLNAFGQLVWTGIMIMVGYAFGNLYLSINGILGKVSVVALVILAFAGLLGYGKYIRARMSRSTEAL
jgi:membrane-associated protein